MDKEFVALEVRTQKGEFSKPEFISPPNPVREMIDPQGVSRNKVLGYLECLEEDHFTTADRDASHSKGKSFADWSAD